ncbi:MAG: N-acetyltransferase [Firmicutes bacterium]|nr:N-acetyltransferase [Bacillota bacterium]
MFLSPFPEKNYCRQNGALVSLQAKIASNAYIGEGTIIYPNVNIADGCHIGSHCIIGEPSASYYERPSDYEFKETFIGNGSIIRSHSIIYAGVEIGDNFQSGHRITIRELSKIGKDCSVGTLSDLQGKLVIGNHVRLHSNVHIGQMSIIDDYVWIYPYVVLTNAPYPPMGELKGVTVKQFAQVCTSAVILPGLTIGENALIGAGAVVTKDVLSERVVLGNPGKDICSVRDLRNEKGKQIYPWKDFLSVYRGYPWQKEEN